MDEHENKWWVELSGDDSEKEELAYLCSQPSCTLCNITKTDTIATKVSSVSTPKKAEYYLKSFQFAKLKNPEEVRVAAKKLLQTVKAVAKLYSNFGFQSISISGRVVGIECGLHVQAFESAPVGKVHSVAVRPIASGLGQDASIPKWYLYDSYRNQLSEWIDDIYMSKAFSYFAGGSSWYNLYLVYEMIKYDTDKTLNYKKDSLMYQWVDENKIDDFTNAANNVFSEDSPRHSLASYLNKKHINGKPQSFLNYKEQKRGKPKPLTSLYEANILIKRLFKNWYELKILEFRLFYFANVAKYLTNKYNLRCFSRAPIQH